MAAHERDPLLSEKSVDSDFTASQTKKKVQIKERIELWRKWSRQHRILLDVLCGTALFGLLILSTHLPGILKNSDLLVHQETIYPSNYSCIPGQSCWPKPAQWDTFNQSVGGKLKLTIPWAKPCYEGSARKDCLALGQGYMDSVERTQQYGSMEFLDWEICGQSSCLLNSFSPASPVAGNCSLGRLSPYHVDVRTAEDITKSLNFVREHGIRVSIKNTGHDYFGRSGSANSLAIWTHNMKETEYHKTFQPKGCKTSYENVGVIGAGIQAQEAWEFFEPLGMMVTVGAINSVGIAGGFGQGGGHGPLAPAYGLMVDQAIEFDVVTADGQLRTINECTDPDLFWAMRGGGGGTYAVLVSYKFQLHPAVPINVYSFQAEFPESKGELNITESEVHRDVIRALASNQTLFAENGIAGYNFLLPDHMISLQILPSTDTEAIKKLTSQWHDFLSTYPGLNITENAYHSFTKFSEWHDFTETPSIAHNAPVGIGLSESGRFIPKQLFSNPEDVENLVDAVVTAMQISYEHKVGGAAQLYATGPTTHPDNSKTGVNPAWRSSLWHVIMGGIWSTNKPLHERTKVQRTISASIEPFKALTPGGGCYVNEGDWTEENWQEAFFGSSYAKLERIKRKWDPSGLFNCWKCVGWTGYEE